MATEILGGVYDITLSDAVGRVRVYLFDGETPSTTPTTTTVTTR